MIVIHGCKTGMAGLDEYQKVSLWNAKNIVSGLRLRLKLCWLLRVNKKLFLI